MTGEASRSRQPSGEGSGALGGGLGPRPGHLPALPTLRFVHKTENSTGNVGAEAPGGQSPPHGPPRPALRRPPGTASGHVASAVPGPQCPIRQGVSERMSAWAWVWVREPRACALPPPLRAGSGFRGRPCAHTGEAPSWVWPRPPAHDPRGGPTCARLHPPRGPAHRATPPRGPASPTWALGPHAPLRLQGAPRTGAAGGAWAAAAAQATARPAAP